MNYMKLYSNESDLYYKNKNFLFSLQLSRLFNSFNMSRRLYFKIPDDDNPINQRDRFDWLIQHGAIVFECINTLNKNINYIRQFESWNADNESVKFIRNQIENKKSFSMTFLKNIRNKLVYHFDQGIFNNEAINYKYSEGETFIEGQSGQNIDYYFPIIDNIILSYLSNIYTSELKDTNIISIIAEKTTEISGHLASTILELTTDILHTYLKWDENNSPNVV